VQQLDENPYACQWTPPDQQLKRETVESLRSLGLRYLATLVADAAPSKTSNYVMGFMLCEAAAALSFLGLYAHLKAAEFSVSEIPQVIMIGGVTGFVALVTGIEYGVVVGHRIWTAIFKSSPRG